MISNPTYQFNLDLLLFVRCLLALLWGIGLAVFLQQTRKGQFLAQERTWLTVVAGIGVDLILSFGGTWWDVTFVVGFSSLGIIYRSLHNERLATTRKQGNGAHYNRVMWSIGDAASLVDDLTGVVETMLEKSGELKPRDVQYLARILRLTNRINRKVRDARKGEYNPKKGED